MPPTADEPDVPPPAAQAAVPTEDDVPNQNYVTVTKFHRDPRPKAVSASTTDGKKVNLNEPIYEFDPRRDFDLDENTVISRKERQRMRLFHKSMKCSFVDNHAQEQAHASRLFNGLLVYLVFLALVLIELFIGRDTEALYWNTANLGYKVATEEFTPLSQDGGPFWGKTFMDIANPGDWYTWAQTVAVPMFYSDDNPDARIYVNNAMLGNNIKVGAMRFRVQRVTDDSCTPERRWIPEGEAVFPQACYSHFRKSPYYNKTNFADYTYRSCSNPIFRRIQGKVRTWACSGLTLDLPFSLSRNFVLQSVADMETNAFVDDFSTRFAIFSAVTYNQALDMFSLAQSWIEVTEGGTFLPQTRTIHFTVMRTQDKVMNILLFLATIGMTIGYFRGLYDAHVHKQGVKYFVDLWNLLSLINYIVFYVMVFTRFVYWRISDDFSFHFDTQESTPKYSDELEYVAVLYDQGMLLFGAVTLLTCLTIMKYLSLNPRLNILTRSLAAAQQDLIGLLILFVVVLLAYSITGNALFGAGIEDFRNIEVSFSSLMRMLLGDVDYDGLRDENFFLAGLFFWSFLLLAMFLLLNFIIAVIGNGFNKENSETKAQPLYDQVSDLLSAIGRQAKRFFRNPAFYLKEQREASKKEYNRGGKYMIIYSAIQRHRHSLPLEDVTLEEFSSMLPEEQDQVMPDPLIHRHTLENLIKEGEDGHAQYEFVTEAFLDEFWLDAAADYELHHEDEINVRVKRRQGLMEKCAELQLRSVLGLTGGAVLDQHSSLTELFAPTKATLDTLGYLQERIDTIEENTDDIATLLVELDALSGELAQLKELEKQVTKTSADKKANEAEVAEDDEPASPLQPKMFQRKANLQAL